MRYLCLIYLNESELAAMPAREASDLNARHLDFNDGLRATGNFLVAEALGPAQETKKISKRTGKVHVTDGPFTEAKEVLGGYAIYDLPDLDAVKAWTKRFLDLHAKHWPEFRGTVEIREMFGMEVVKPR